MKKRVVSGLILGGVLLFAVRFAIAQESPETAVMMEEVVVTGIRAPQEVRRIPASVTVVDQEDIRKSNAKNLPDLLQSKEGIVVRDLLGNGKTAQIDLRGFGESGPYNTLVLVDGRRVNAPDLSGVDWSQVPLEQVERVEIVRGMGSVMYGDNASGGVINIVTKVPRKGLAGSVEGTVGSYSRHKERFSLSMGRRSYGVSVFGSYESTDGYRENNDYRVKDLGGKLVFDPTDYLRLNLSGSVHSDEYGLPGDLSEDEFRRDPEASNDPLDEADTMDRYAKIGLELDLREWGLFTTDFSYRTRENNSEYPDTSFPFVSESEIDTVGVTPRHVWESTIGGHRNQLILGFDGYWTDQEIKSFTGTFTPIVSPSGRDTIERSRFGFYVADEFDITEHFILSVGARRERVRDKLKKRSLPSGTIDLDETITERETALRAGVTYLYDERSSLFARYNKSFRFPLTDELIETNQTTFATIINEDLKPQTGDHFEFGVRHFFSTAVQGSLTFFRAEIDDEIFYDPRPKPFVGTNENHPETLHQGIEASAKAKLSDDVTVFGNYTYEEATFEKDPFRGNDIPAVPEHTANLGARIADILPHLDLSVVYNYVGSSYLISDQANSLDKLDDYDTIDVRLSYELARWKAFFGVNNALNEEYAQYAATNSAGTTRNFYPAPDRNWFAGMEISF